METVEFVNAIKKVQSELNLVARGMGEERGWSYPYEYNEVRIAEERRNVNLNRVLIGYKILASGECRFNVFAMLWRDDKNFYFDGVNGFTHHGIDNRQFFSINVTKLSTRIFAEVMDKLVNHLR